MATPRNGRAFVRLLAFCVSCVALPSGCALPGRTPPPPVATYVLDGQASLDAAVARPAEGAPNAILKVANPTAAPAYGSPRMAYIETPYRIDYFADNQWADSPARMLKTLLTQYLGDTGLFRFVYADAGGIDEQLRLDTDIIELAQVFSPDSSEVRLSIRFSLVDVPHRTLLLNRTISVTEAAAARDPYAGVVAANKAVQRALDELTALLKATLPTLQPPG
jgi:cholesterol transport system auxiliary component